MSQMPKKSQEFNKVAECLCRNGNKLYYALVKVNGKQIRRSLQTNELTIAKRRLGPRKRKLPRGRPGLRRPSSPRWSSEAIRAMT